MTAAALSPAAGRAQPMSAGWIFSRAEDAWVFLGAPLLISGALVGLAAASGWSQHADAAYPASFILYALIDLSHQYSTAALTLGFSDEYHHRRRFYLLAPPLVCAALIALHAASPLAFFRFYALYSAYHFIRQQYGWMTLASRRAPAQPSAAERAADTCAIYTATIGPLLYMCSTLDAPSWFVTGDLVPLPPWVAPLALHLTAGVALAYLGWQWWLARQGALNPGKLFIYLKTLAIWGGAFILTADTLWGVALIIAHHGIPYLYMAARYTLRRLATPEGRRAWRLQPSPQTPTEAPPWRRHAPWLIGAIWLTAAAHFLLEAHLSDWLAPLGITWLDALIVGGLYPALASVGILHFITDAFFWKSKHNPHLRVLAAPAARPHPPSRSP
jgi:hypothetical protein